jgi:hypothetical protein
MNYETDRNKCHWSNYTRVDEDLSYIKLSLKYMWVPNFTHIPSMFVKKCSH